MDNYHLSILLNQQYLINNYINYLNTCNRNINRLQTNLLDYTNNYYRHHTQNTYTQNTYNQDTYNQDTYNQDTYNQDTYNQYTYNQDTYNQDTYNQDTYNQDTSNQDTYNDYNYIYNNLLTTSTVLDNEYFKNLSTQNIETIIEENIEFKKYKDIENPIDEHCGISQEEFNEEDDVGIFKSCKHIFTKDNILNWSRRHLTCPNCRNNLLYNTTYIKYSEIDNLNINNLDNVYIFNQNQLASYISWKLSNSLFRS